MISKSYLLVALIASLPAFPAGPLRDRMNFDAGWRFLKADAQGGERPGFDDSTWRKLNLPHDWSIEGPYSSDNAAGTGFLPGGVGWYRKSFQLPDSSRAKRFAVEFDGVYRDSDVWINGRHLGHRPYGYSSFEYDLTPYVKFGSERNVIAVRVDHRQHADSRWYTGSGIYRHVWLTSTGPVRVAQWGTYVYTPVVKPAEALVTIETRVANDLKSEAAVRLVTSIENGAGAEVASVSSEERIQGGGVARAVQQVAVSNPALWSIESPALYNARTRVYVDGKLSDEYRTQFGIRSIRFDANHGFFLNGQPLKFKGVCIHHDLGALGAAFSRAVLERRLKTLKSIGVNAIRCSHNPMAPELYELCDRIGMLVMDEAFDEWTEGKHKWIEGWNKGKPGTDGYHEAFAQWSTRDIQDLVLRDRNHPSIVMWSIGNEIDYPGDPFGHARGRDGLKPGMLDANVLPSIARQLISAVKALDGTRPVTQALADNRASNAVGLADLLDVAGYNYLEQFYAADHEAYPQRIILGSENSHSLAAWRAVASNEYVLGQFLWTGVDYLGESRLYPARGSTSGLLDFCGFRKPLSYLREALWSDRPMVYAAAYESRPMTGPRTGFETNARPGRPAEHWNWEQDARKSIPVAVYTNCSSAELLLNGRSLGEKQLTDRLDPTLRWDVPNEPGTVQVIGKRDGREAARFALVTADKPDHLELQSDRAALSADGSEVVHIEIRVVDRAGRRVLPSAHPITVRVTGAGELVAVDSGNPTDVTLVSADHRNAFEGRILAIVRPNGTGTITVQASSPDLRHGELRITVR